MDDKLVGVIVCRMEEHRGYMRGYIAMVAVDKAFRKQGIGELLRQCVRADATPGHALLPAPQALSWHSESSSTCRPAATRCVALGAPSQQACAVKLIPSTRIPTVPHTGGSGG